ncbi:hypothetical protein N7509_012115 [Penicillium cosmopolitanum]|uniref:Uncharacterized protein n=1 Tax=Penicillium cosmopolitanum TaxID=1131564 RepID=A0A9W9SI19_9EURO|nr:uncharacterized protein N7509_012115 [Penicillium cosmopolitanum]KAJ5378996.1 hypothetical protein N7509_012115 [Penicillium cosmopolitanum]
MATGFSATPRKEGTWTKLVIFVSLFFLILESVLQLVLVLFLYGRHQVDSKMTVSLVLAMVSSFMTIPLISLQSLVAWQYNKIGGFGQQKTVLHNICSYVYRLDLMLWLATSVSGLVVAAQQVYCLPDGTDATFWRVGTSCAFHRSTVIVSVVALVTVCTMYCARELCDRPYDVSIIGIYKSQQALRDGSILSGNSWDSDETLKNEILNLCRQHDGKAGEEPWYIDPIANKVSCHPSIRHPAPVRLRPQLRLNTNPGSEYGEITSGTTISPDDTYPRTSPGGQTVASDFYPISRTSTLMTTTTSESKNLLAEFFAPKVPPIPKQYTAYHKRGKSSLSSLKRFFPKTFPLSLPLSSDPQIRALADPNSASDVEKQVVTPSTSQGQSQFSFLEIKTTDVTETHFSSGDTTQTPTKSASTSTTNKPDGHNRTMTMNSADAPEVVVEPPEPAKVRRSQTEHLAIAGRSIHHPHHPNFVAGSTPSPAPPVPSPVNARKYSASCRQNTSMSPVSIMPPSRSSSRHNMQPQIAQLPAPTRSSSYSFEQSHKPRHIQSQYHQQQQYYSPQPIPTRWASQHVFDPSRVIPAPRRNDVEIIYPSTRRPRSNTHGGASGPLSCILEATPHPRASVDEIRLNGGGTQARRSALDHSTYRGANRTSMGFY